MKKKLSGISCIDTPNSFRIALQYKSDGAWLKHNTIGDKLRISPHYSCIRVHILKHISMLTKERCSQILGLGHTCSVVRQTKLMVFSH